jgi:hypothetical protein
MKKNNMSPNGWPCTLAAVINLTEQGANKWLDYQKTKDWYEIFRSWVLDFKGKRMPINSKSVEILNFLNRSLSNDYTVNLNYMESGENPINTEFKGIFEKDGTCNVET